MDGERGTRSVFEEAGADNKAIFSTSSRASGVRLCRALRAGIKSVNTRVVIGNKLNNEKFKAWPVGNSENQNSPIIVFKVFTEFILF